MITLAILNMTHLANKGSRARLEGMINCLKKTIPNVHIVLFHRYYKEDKDNIIKQLKIDNPKLDIQQHPWFREYDMKIITAICAISRFLFLFLFNSFHKFGLFFNKKIQDYDVIVDLNIIEPDIYPNSSIIKSAMGLFFTLLNTYYGIFIGKPVVICSATIGPYQNKILRFLASYVFNRVNLITLREEDSKGYLKRIGVERPAIHLSADLAFFLSTAEDEKIYMILKNKNIALSNTSLIGIAPTAMMHPFLKKSKYVKLMADLSDYLVEHMNASIIYIVHTYQDLSITKDIYQILKNKDRARIIYDISSAEMKGVIGKCEIFLGSRFHALVQSTAMSIPTLGLVSYSYRKFHGVIGKMMGMEDYLIDVDEKFNYDLFFNLVLIKIKNLYLNKDLISKNLKDRVELAKKRILNDGILIKNIAESVHSNHKDLNA